MRPHYYVLYIERLCEWAICEDVKTMGPFIYARGYDSPIEAQADADFLNEIENHENVQ